MKLVDLLGVCQSVATRYDQLFSDIPGVSTPYRAERRAHIFHQYTIRVADGKRDALQQPLKEHGIGTLIYYPLPLHFQECFQNLGYKQGDLLESERASQEGLSRHVLSILLYAYILDSCTWKVNSGAI